MIFNLLLVLVCLTPSRASWDRAVDGVLKNPRKRMITKMPYEHSINYTGNLNNAPAVPASFHSPFSAAEALLQYGLGGLQSAVWKLDKEGVPYDESAVRAVFGAYQSYYRSLFTVLNMGAEKYNSIKYEERNLAFWTSFHPTLGCANTERIGFAPDGPRFVCNGQQLGHNGNVTVVGFGSNNQWEWEDALLHQRHATFNAFRVTSIHTLDCTVKEEAITPPSACHGVCTYHSLCVGKTDTTTTMRIASMGTRLGISNVALLKLDVEGWEYVAVLDWFHEAMKQNKKGTSTTIPYIQQVQMEVHRLGHRFPAGSSWESLLNTHLLFLHMYALGFVPVQYERNHMDDCCYEFTFVHHAWYIQSEYRERSFRDHH